MSVGSGTWIQNELKAPRAPVYGLPLRHYIMGRFDDKAYYWPERHVRLFKKGFMGFGETVHGPYQTDMDKVYWLPIETGVCIEHLSHPDVATWIAKANRYTSIADRVSANDFRSPDLIAYTMSRLAYWVEKSDVQRPGDYPQAAALLRATYDIIDRLKLWEKENNQDGQQAFKEKAQALIDAYLASEGKAFVPRPCQMLREEDLPALMPASVPAEPPSFTPPAPQENSRGFVKSAIVFVLRPLVRRLPILGDLVAFVRQRRAERASMPS
jgi:hypothetical protein